MAELAAVSLGETAEFAKNKVVEMSYSGFSFFKEAGVRNPKPRYDIIVVGGEEATGSPPRTTTVS